MWGMNRDAMAQSLASRDAWVPTTSSSRPYKTPEKLKLIITLWLTIVIGSVLLLQFHATAPGPNDAAPTRWPQSSRIAASDHGATLLVFVHPFCPCARATLDELAVIMQKHRDQVVAHVLFVTPADEQPNWVENELWQTTAAIPGARAVIDANAIEAAYFGARTSGLALLFDEDGKCRFSGGITASRGHAGDNSGRQAIIGYLTSRSIAVSRAPTFGCPLLSDKSPVSPGINQ